MKVVSAAEMREIDRATSERFGISSLSLMENAGAAVARFVVCEYPLAERVGVVCGKGNNGGDGFVAARKLLEAGRGVRVLLLSDPGELRGDAAEMFRQLLPKLQATNSVPVIVLDASGLESAQAEEIFASDVIADAILGTGFRPPMSALYAGAIAKMNAAAGQVVIVAVDIPSGADADAERPSGSGSGQARADAVVTFTAPRPAHVFAELTGGLTVVADIGSPPEAIVSKLGLNLCSPADFARLLRPREREGNKGNYGHVLVVGGSLGKAGAAAMAGIAALRAGAGLATVATAKSVLATVAGFHPEVMTEPQAETEEGTIALGAWGSGFEKLIRGKTVAVGPGISRNSETSEFVRKLVDGHSRGEPSSGGDRAAAMVIDADGLNAFEGSAEKLNGRGRVMVISPHPGEMSRLTGMTVAEIQANRLDVARRFAREHELIVVLKGHRTLIASADGTVWVNATGNPGMATGGTGDILTGIVAGLVAQHPEHALEATALAVYLHGLAGDLASGELGENSVVATDLVRFLPAAFRMTRKQKSGEFRFHA